MTDISTLEPWTWEPGPCGRPTKSKGAPCGNRRLGWLPACPLHVTAEEKAAERIYRRGMDDARKEERSRFSVGYEMGMQAGAKMADARREQAALREVNMRYEEDGCQIVTVSGGYAYLWDGPEPLKIGDDVWLPANWLSRVKSGPGSLPDTVTGFGTDYVGGPLSRLVGRRTEVNPALV